LNRIDGAELVDGERNLDQAASALGVPLLLRCGDPTERAQADGLRVRVVFVFDFTR
jgi:hypothetical protein